MGRRKIQTPDDVSTYREGIVEIEFFIVGKDERYWWIMQILVRFLYLVLGRGDCGVVLAN